MKHIGRNLLYPLSFYQYFLNFFVVFFIQLIFGGAGSSNSGYIDPNLYSGISIDYRFLNTVYSPENISNQDTYAISRLPHIIFLSIGNLIFGNLTLTLTTSFLTALTGLAYVYFTKNVFKNHNFIFLLASSFLVFLPIFNYDARWTDESISVNMLYTWSIVLLFKYCLIDVNLFSNLKLIYISGFLLYLATISQIKILVLTFILFTFLFLFRFINLKILYKLFIGFTLGLFVTELINYILLKKIDELMILRQIRFVLGVGLTDQGVGEWSSVSISNLFNIGNSYIIAPLFAILLIKPKSKIFNFHLILILSYFFSFIIYQFILKFPMLETWWYFGTFSSVLSIIILICLNINNNKKKTVVSKYFRPLFFIFFICNIFLNPYQYNNLNIFLFSIFFIFLSKDIFRNLIFVLITIILFQQPPLGDLNKPIFQTKNTISSSAGLYLDQKWLISIYKEYYFLNSEKIVPIWYPDDTTGYLGSVQSSLGFGLTRLHGLGNNGLYPRFDLYFNNLKNSKTGNYLFVLDNIDQTSIREIRHILYLKGFKAVSQHWSPSQRITLVIYSIN